MLVIDDFNELVGLETLFRRLGFDVLSLGRESQVAEAVLGFQADLAIATGRGRNVDGLNLAPKLRYGTSQPKLVVLLPVEVARGAEHDADLAHADVDAVIETPFDPTTALKVVAKLLGLAEEPLLEKYAKIASAKLVEPEEMQIIRHAVVAEPLIHVTSTEGAPRPGSESAPWAQGNNKPPRESTKREQPKSPPRELSARESRYAKFLEDKGEEELPPLASGDVMREARKALEISEENASIEDVQKAAELAREKREFVRAMVEAGQPLVAPEIVREIESVSRDGNLKSPKK